MKPNILDLWGVNGGRHSTASCRKDQGLDLASGCCILRLSKAGERIACVQAHSAFTTSLKRSSETGLLGTCSSSGEIRVWTDDLRVIAKGSVEQELHHLSWSPDGNKLAVAGSNSVFICSLKPGGTVQVEKELLGCALWCEWTALDHLLAVSQTDPDCRGTVEAKLFQQDGTLTSTLVLSGQSRVTLMTEVLGGASVVCLGDGTACVVEVDGNTLRCGVRAHIGRTCLSGAMLSGGNTVLLGASDGKYRMLHRTGALRVAFEGPTNAVRSLQVWQGDGCTPRIWIGCDGALHVVEPPPQWLDDGEVPTGKCTEVHVAQQHQITCCGVAMGPDNLVAAGDFGGQVVVWRSGDSHPVWRCQLPGSVRAVVWGSDMRRWPLLAALLDGSLWVCTPHGPVRVSGVDVGGIANMRWAHGSHTELALGTMKGCVVVIRLRQDGERWSADVLHHIEAHDKITEEGLTRHAEVWSVAWHPSNKLVASASEDKTIRIWNLDPTGAAAPALRTTLRGYTMAVTSLDWQQCSPAVAKSENVLVSCSDDHHVRVFDGESLTLIHNFCTDHLVPGWHTLTYLALDAQANSLAVATQNGFVVVWNLIDSECLAAFRIHWGSIEGLAWDPDTGKIATCSGDHTVSLFQLTPQPPPLSVA